MHKAMTLGWLFSGVVLWTGCGVQAVSEVGGPIDAPATAADDSAEENAVQEASAEEPAEQAAAESPASEIALPSLGEQLAELSAKSKERMPAQIVQVFTDGIEEVRSTGIVESALNVGAQAIDGELPDANGSAVKLSDLWAKGPVVVVWYRGGWCPYCNLQLRAMQEALPAIKAKGGTMIAITPETPDNSLSTVEKNELEFVVLSDVGNELAKKYGVVFKLPEKVSPIYKQMIDLSKYNGNDSDELPLAATYVIDQSGKIRYAFLDANYTARAEPADVVAALETL